MKEKAEYDHFVIILSHFFQAIFTLVRDTVIRIDSLRYSSFGDLFIMTVLILIVIGALLAWTFLQDASAPR